MSIGVLVASRQQIVKASPWCFGECSINGSELRRYWSRSGRFLVEEAMGAAVAFTGGIVDLVKDDEGAGWREPATFACIYAAEPLDGNARLSDTGRKSKRGDFSCLEPRFT
jgi:hypothetical protein